MPPVHAPARSYRLRRRRLTPARAAVFERMLTRWSLAQVGDVLDLTELFPDQRDVVLDIGFGGGEGLVEMAAARATEAIIGVEVHTSGVVMVLDAIEANAWSHVRVAMTDVIDFMPRIPPASLTAIRLWFPDPWPKNKQKHRRLVRPALVAEWADRLRPGGVLHIATDIADYADHVEEVMAAEPSLVGGVVERPNWRPLTRFEARGLAEGRSAIDLWYERVC